jgi:4-aminobutyrate aminotransferase-like enzyme
MKTTNDPCLTQAAALAADTGVQSAIQAILSALEDAQANITGASPPTEGLGEQYLDWLDRAAAVRGRPCLYPYIGSGFGNGPLVELADGSVKWDMINGIGVHMFGHSHPVLVRAALEAGMSDVVMQGNLQFNSDSVVLSELLVEEASRSSSIRHCFMTNSGAMANESALKICQQKTNGAPRVIAFTDCFMGRTTTMAQIGDSAGGRSGVPLNMQVDYMPFFDVMDPEGSITRALQQLEQYIKRYPKQHSCFTFELIQGEGGFIAAPREFFVPLMERCKDAGIPVWCDEVQTFGRTDSMFRFAGMDLGELVDVVTIGKMSQVCAALYTEDFNPAAGLLSGTFIASTSAFHVGLAALQTLRDGDYYGPDGRINKLQAAWREHADRFVAAHPEFFDPIIDESGRSNSTYVEGTGGMMRLTPFGGDQKRIMRALHVLFREGVVAFICGHNPYHLRFLAPVGVMEPEQFEPIFEILGRAFARSESDSD